MAARRFAGALTAGVRSSPGASRAISCSKTLQARVVSVLGAKRETSTQAANMRSRGNQFWNQRILFIEGHRWFQNSRLRLGA